DKCIGCNLCMLACQIENNIPVVGEKIISRNRDLFWINVLKLPKSEMFYFLPLMCQHCNYAPCESVCPVGATSHSSEGINEMTYNQCIGSRFCMANCPYHVRKFNFQHPEKSHIHYIPEIMNPLVTVRSRGVSEKCTFCIHKLNFAKTKAKLFNESSDFPIQTACQAACPVQAIDFGRKKQLLTKEKKNYLYLLLQNFNTHPNVYYKSTKNDQTKG
ncbi:MAG: 4Fe-4S dicluster domain-containing protein, partial [Candidatus Kapaibacteriota bacterium]